ncbi:MAG: twin-arginine translocation signal domain-containing protein [Sedimentisphaerales bacterium]|nr:twin-arginine translocation signal domain-containing protein [Sedimentisphaerales bacterium]
MRERTTTRRDFVKAVAAGAAGLTIRPARAADPTALIAVDPEPRFELSPYLHMQFMEPLGTTDGSVAAAWDFGRDCWRDDVVDATRRLGTPLLRWGGCLASYYRWREGVGPRDKRQPYLNTCWGGLDTNQVGTHEFVDFARQAGAEPFFCVNFESDGKPYFAKDAKGNDRCAGPEEAADWVDYCNNPDNRQRIANGAKEPFNLKLWQLGNETSYGGTWKADKAAERTIAFAKAMRRRDPDLQLIGWGDSGWARQILETAGEHLQYIAFHHMFNPDRGLPNSPLRDIEYRKDPAWTWERLMNVSKAHEARIKRMREQTAGFDTPLALTECHLALPGRNRCEVLSTWAAGVANARMLNVHERHGDKLKIATLADFCGTRWQVNAIMIPVPGGKSYLMPVALVMSLYRHHTGERAVSVSKAPDALDVTASRTGEKVFLHVVNTSRKRAIRARLDIAGRQIRTGRIFEMAADPEFEVTETRPDEIKPVEKKLAGNSEWSFPAASVSAVELELAQA